jgi:hypothetical protein
LCSHGDNQSMLPGQGTHVGKQLGATVIVAK